MSKAEPASSRQIPASPREIPASPRDIIETLHQQIRQCETAGRSAWRQRFSSGYAELDRVLPERGFCRGSLVEWLAAVPGSGTSTLALTSAWQACQAGRALVVVDRQQVLYPPAAVGLGIELERLIVVRPGNEADEAWAVDQALRCSGVGGVVCWPAKLDDHTFRRWQLAAESGGTIGFLVRGRAARGQPSWAELRFEVTPLAGSAKRRLPEAAGRWGPTGPARRLRVEVLRCRGGSVGGTLELEIDTQNKSALPEASDETNSLHLASWLAPAAAALGSTRT